ncbi:phosphotransferase [Actinophytocola sediminis]
MNRAIDPVLLAATSQAGIEAAGAALIRDGSNLLYRLPHGVVARIGQPGLIDRAAREVALSRWLFAEGIPVVETAPDVPQHLVIGNRPVTWWVNLPDHRAATPAELAQVLRNFHALSPPGNVILPSHDPFAGFDDCVQEKAGILDEAERLWLVRRIDQLRARYRPPGEAKLLHGDAWQGNIAVTETGRAILLDLENVSLGWQVWDLVLIAADYTDFARISDHEYRSFVDGYGGFDITHHRDYRTLADIAELRWTCFALRKAATSATAAREVHHRIACLRGRHPRPWTWNAL